VTPVFLVVGGLGVALFYSALTGQPLVESLRRTFTTPASTRTPVERTPVLGDEDYGRALRENRNGSGGAMTPGGGDGGGGGGAGARFTGSPAPSTSGGNPCRALPVPSADQLVSIGQLGHRLRADAAASLARAERAAGGTISVTDSFRSREQQEDCHRRKPTLCAPAGGSCHEKGIAIDVVDMNNRRIIDALTAEGWQRFDPAREPWHWSYGVRG
jgi:hypothetical protein